MEKNNDMTQDKNLRPPRKSQPRGQRSAQKILSTAQHLFTSKGIEATTIDEIVEIAGLSKGTFYHHFESKASLLDALRSDFINKFGLHISNAIATCPQDNHDLKLITWIYSASNIYIELGELHDIVFSGSGFLVWSAVDEDFMKDFIKLLNEGVAAGIWKMMDTELTAIFIFRGLLGVLDDCQVRERSTQDILDKVANFSLAMLKNCSS